MPLIAMIVTPFLYIAYIWDELPDRIPMHWNAAGEIDRYGDKSEMWMLPFMLPVLAYVLMTVVPYIDPKKKIEQMGGKYHTLKFYLVLSTTLLCMGILFMMQQGGETKNNWIAAGIGFMFLVLGNFFKTIQPNYFVGIRTPWTLEHPVVWKKTHLLGGKLWFVGGLCLMALAFILPPQHAFIFLMIVSAILVFVPIVYSYLEFKKLGAAQTNQ